MNHRSNIVLVMMTLLLVLGCQNNQTPHAQIQREKQLANTYNTDEQSAKNIISLNNIPKPANFIYIRDPRPEPDICYSYLWKTSGANGSAIGGPSHTTVNCEHVQTLIINPPPAPPDPDANTSREQQLKQLRDQQAPSVPELLQP